MKKVKMNVAENKRQIFRFIEEQLRMSPWSASRTFEMVWLQFLKRSVCRAIFLLFMWSFVLKKDYK